MTKSALNSDLAVSARAAGAAAPAAEQLDFLAPVAERINRADADAIAANATEERKRGTMTPEEMARRLDCKVVEAFDRQVAIWDKLAPYVAAKLAPTDEKGNAVPGLVISIGDQAINAGIGVSAGGSPPWLAAYRDAEGRIIEGVEIQGVSRSGADGTDQEGGS